MTLSVNGSASTPAAFPEWTVLVYMVSDEPSRPDIPDIVDLDQVLSSELKALLKAVVPSVNVAIQVDFFKPHGTFRWVHGRLDATRQESSSADPSVLQRFLEWGIARCPARRYAVLFWGHSSGPSGLFSDEAPLVGATNPRKVDTLDLREIGVSLQAAAVATATTEAASGTAGSDGTTIKGSGTRPIDIVIFKDCYQSLLETAFELGGNDRRADFMIASQGLIPVATEADASQGPQILKPWPYRRLLRCFDQRDTKSVVRDVLGALGRFYHQKANRADHIEVPMAAVDLRAIGGFAVPFDKLRRGLVTSLQDPLHSERIDDAFRRSFRGVVDGDPLLVDVASLCERLGEMGIAPLSESADLVNRALGQVVVGRTPRTSNFGGLSVYYYPQSPAERLETAIGLVHAAAYRRLRFNALTGWHEVALARTPSALARARFA